MPDQKQKKVSPAKITSTRIPTQLQKSAVFRKYRISTVIKRDFAGVLYRTETKSGGKRMAVKILSPGYYVSSNTLLGNIDHSRICKIWDSIIEKDGTQSVVIEEPSGSCVADIVGKDGALSAGEAVSATLQLLSALHAVHWNDALVGNLHSESVFLSHDEHGNMELQLINFGIGCREDDQREPYYLSPEQVSQTSSPNRQSDIWAAGVLFYEMLFGKRPFDGANQYEIAGEILLKEPVFHDQWTNLPDDLVVILKRALAKDVSDRYDNVTMMVADLLPFQDEFDEPISEAARRAIRESYPPPAEREKRKKRPQGKTSGFVKNISKPLQVLSSASDGGKKKTMMGIPVMDFSSKKGDSEKRESTEEFSFTTEVTADSPEESRSVDETAEQDLEPLADAEAPLSIHAGEGPEESEKDEAVSPDKKGDAPSPVVAGRKAAYWARRGLALLSEKPKLAYPIVGGVILLAVVLFANLLSGKDDLSQEDGAVAKKTADAQKMKSAVSPDDKIQETKVAVSVSGAKDEASQAPQDPSSQAPEGDGVAASEGDDKSAVTAEPKKEKITILLEGLPRRSVVRVNQKRVKVPIVMKPSDKPIIVYVRSKGYEQFHKTVVPNQDMVIELNMERVGSARKRSFRGKGKAQRKAKSSAKSNNDLATNPFGEQ